MTAEALRPGREHESEYRVVSEADIAAFAVLSGDRNPLHLDVESAHAAGFTAPIAHGALGIAIATGLVSGLGVTRGVLIALLELRWHFAAPLVAGDRVRVRLTVREIRETSRRDRRVAVMDVVLEDATGKAVQRGELVELVRAGDA